MKREFDIKLNYEVLSKGALIGWTDLSYGDPPMGVVFGVLKPSDHYSSRLNHEPVELRLNGELLDLAGAPAVVDDCTGMTDSERREFIDTWEGFDMDRDFHELELNIRIFGLPEAPYRRYFSAILKQHGYE